MYHKLINEKLEKFILKVDEQTLRRAIGQILGKQEIAKIVDIYQKRLCQEVGFNKEIFFLDLKAYLQNFSKCKKSWEAVSNRYCSAEFLITSKDYDIWGMNPYGDLGSCKKAYFDKKTNKIYRLYYQNPTAFFYKKLFGISEAKICNSLNNNLLTVWGQDVAGAPFDIQEKALPLSQVFSYLRSIRKDNLIAEIEMAKNSNIVISDFIESRDNNVGLVVRQDSVGQKRVYVVAFDLESKHRLQTEKSIRGFINEMCQQAINTQPQYLEYERLVNYLPALQSLEVRKIDSGRNLQK